MFPEPVIIPTEKIVIFVMTPELQMSSAVRAWIKATCGADALLVTVDYAATAETIRAICSAAQACFIVSSEKWAQSAAPLADVVSEKILIMAPNSDRLGGYQGSDAFLGKAKWKK